MGLVVVSTLVTSRASLSTRAVMPGVGQRAERPARAGLSGSAGCDLRLFPGIAGWPAVRESRPSITSGPEYPLSSCCT
jgi:hypothetical protein